MTTPSTLKQLIVDRLFLDITPDQIDTDTPLADYGIDSFLLLELIVGIEESFQIKFGQQDINANTLKSVASLTVAIEAKQSS